MPAAVQSIAELERLLEERRNQVQSLVERRERLQQQLHDLDAEMHAILNFETLPRQRRRAPRVKNELPLSTAIRQVLAKNRKGLTLADLETQVKETGYKSASRNFRNVVYQAVYHATDIVRDEATGKYKLQK